ncbi:MAG: hypothetical protein EA381_19415 [Planctomycetaceae bacterium]|nr:MAG: hypothetical protein EA381_19415 [Planctomycetaceae bacterium]
MLLAKARGELDHGGGEVLAPDSTGYRILETFVRRTRRVAGLAPDHDTDPSDTFDPQSAGDAASEPCPPFFEGVTMLTPAQVLRRVTLSLAGRLPTDDESDRLRREGQPALDSILDDLMREDAFFERLQEGFNDIFLTVGIEDNAETLLSYDHFEKSRLWYQKHDLSHLPEADQQRARWKLADVYREALLREPLELITHLVRNDRPFTELLTADYILVSPYTARGYGIFEDIKDQFQDPEDPFEYIPAKLPALTGRNGKTQESPTGLFPHAGLFSSFHYLRRYPTTDTNRNRLRARMFYQHFLGLDVMESAPRSTDSAAVSAEFENPTMQAADCVVCHRSIDPVAGLFQDFDMNGGLAPRKEGWYTDMFVAGFEGETLTPEEKWRALPWLAERTAQDPRFAVAMVEHVLFILTGRGPNSAPQDIDDPLFIAKRRAYVEQRQMIEQVADRFRESGFDLKEAFKAIVASEFFRADGLAEVAVAPHRLAELEDIGVVRLLSPEQLERKLHAIFGKRWGRLEGEMKILYGGIDSLTVTQRNTDPSGAMGAIQRIMANDVACEHVARDFLREPAERRLFPRIEPDVVPGEVDGDRRIRAAVVDLHSKLLGRDLGTDDPEIERTFQLFAGIVADAKASGSYEPRESYFCGGRDEFRVDDPHYTIRAWRGVVTYLLRQHDFLYE